MGIKCNGFRNTSQEKLPLLPTVMRNVRKTNWSIPIYFIHILLMAYILKTRDAEMANIDSPMGIKKSEKNLQDEESH